MLTSLLQWFTGYGRYMTLYHCMDMDVPWVAITVGLEVTIAAGYAVIAMHWWRNQRQLTNARARSALGSMRNIFVFCGLCGYLFIPIKMFWPAWRLYDFVLVVLAYFTWKYAWGARDLKVVYSELHRTQKLEDDLEQTREESQRKSLFFNAISHDLRTPLNGLTLQAHLAEMSLGEQNADALRQALAEIKASAKATADLLDAFLECARLDWTHEPDNLTVFDLLDAAETVIKNTQPQAESKGLTVRSEAACSCPVRTDRVKLERILFNLVHNGVKFTDAGGVRVTCAASGRDMTVRVIDTGVGISAEDQRRLFDDFYQVNNRERDRSKGFGLGLAIARRLARQLNGDVTVESAPGKGSTFSVFLPGIVAPGHAARGGNDGSSGELVAAGEPAGA